MDTTLHFVSIRGTSKTSSVLYSMAFRKIKLPLCNITQYYTRLSYHILESTYPSNHKWRACLLTEFPCSEEQKTKYEIKTGFIIFFHD